MEQHRSTEHLDRARQRVRATAGAVLAAAFVFGAAACRQTEPAPPPTPPAEPDVTPTSGWTDLFDGETLDGWQVSEFDGGGEVRVEDGQVILETGTGDLTGITWTGHSLPDIDYEVTYEAIRLAGSDFFGTLTFPVFDRHCSLVLGGWGGDLVGISSFDWMDASENETGTGYPFENDRWYRVRVRVRPETIDAWIDDERIVHAEPGEREIDVRSEVEASKPFGLAAWQTQAALRNIRIRRLKPEEMAAE